ncbi:MAG: ion transporter [Candidatus Delongbacteria bacterium]|nr:ion transporter [Candidatus Delongbacteria bacterium]MBN2837055.1 ion transporter [Candidatus Delongbacteria bacterium]
MIIMNILRKLLVNIRSFNNSKILFILVLVLVTNFTFGLIFYLLEKDVQNISLLDSIWWAMVTMTTVGYGDFFPKTVYGRFLLSYPTMLIGIGIIGYIIGNIADYILDFTSRKRRGLIMINKENHIIICNYPGEDKLLSVINELRFVPELQFSPIVLITELLDELPEILKDKGVLFVKGEPINENTFLKANVFQSLGVIILSEDQSSKSDERCYTVSSMIEIMEKNYGKPIKTITEVVKDSNFSLMKRAEVDGIVGTENINTQLIVQEFVNPGINDVFKQFFTNSIGSQFYISDCKLEGNRFKDIQIKAISFEEDIQIIGVINGTKTDLNPSKEYVIKEGDRVIFLSQKFSVYRKFEQKILN